MTPEQFAALSDSIAAGIVCLSFAVGYIGGLWG